MPPLSDALRLRPDSARFHAFVIAFTGAGGKTSALFALARELVDYRVIATTTTKLRDPRLEAGRPIDSVIVERLLAEPAGEIGCARAFAPRQGSGALILASGVETEERKLVGIDPSQVEALRERCDFVLVEADGSRGLPIKAPAAHEPVVPGCADLVVGLIGLDCLGLALGPKAAQRSEILGPLIGCAEGMPIGPEHLLRLAASPMGLFKGAPPGARRAILLNQADAVSSGAALALVEALVEGQASADIVIACSLRDGYGACEIVAARRRSAEDRP
jgi:probable selenium-dependent hydroxylase accessory protein YqeC